MAYGNSPAEIADYKNFAVQMASQYGIPADLLLWQIGSESSWNPNAKNPNSTAKGLGQFIDGTAAWRGVDVTDPYDSIQGTASYMQYLKGVTGSWEKALNAYGTTHDNPKKAAEAAAILANNDGRTLIGVTPGGGTEIYAVNDPGFGGTGGSGKVFGDSDAGAQADGAGVESESTGIMSGLFSGVNLDWLKSLLGSVPLILLGLALILLALWSREK